MTPPVPDPPAVLITDAHAPAVLAATRMLADAGFHVGVTASAPRSATHWSSACGTRHFTPDPGSDGARFVARLAALVQRERYGILIPGSDASLLAVSRHRALLPADLRVGLPPNAVVEASLDKQSLAAAVRAVGLPTPAATECTTPEDALRAADAFGYPVVLKPLSTVFDDRGTVRQRASRVVASERELRASAGLFGSPFVLQERVVGATWSLTGVLADGRFASLAMARYDRTWPALGGNASFATTVDLDPALVEAARRLLGHLGWHGIFQLEFIRREADGSFVPIDLNPRPYGSLSLAAAAGAPHVAVWCRVLLGEHAGCAVGRTGQRYRWEDGDLRRALWSVRHERSVATLASMRPHRGTVHAYFRARDPAPLAARVAEIAGRAARGALGGPAGRDAPRRTPGPDGGDPGRAMACVLGDMDLVRPVGVAGIPCAVQPTWDSAVRRSRFAQASLEGSTVDAPPEVLLDRLERFSATQAEPPVLLWESDADLLFVSRHRERLARSFRFLLPDAGVVETLVDKARFQELAERLGLPVPRGVALNGTGATLDGLGLAFPVAVKPLNRCGVWEELANGHKAVRVLDEQQFGALSARAAAAGLRLIAQELVPGPEQRIESYHAWFRADGSVAGEFTGRKIRTLPREHGHSTALEVTDMPDVRELGRDVAGRLGLRGAMKLDFKRDPRGELRLLEVNPRFSLWANVGAAAGVNLPAIAYADLTGCGAPPAGPPRAGATWCHPLADFRAARGEGASVLSWARWALTADALSGVAWDDPLPFLDKLARRTLRGMPGKASRPPTAC